MNTCWVMGCRMILQKLVLVILSMVLSACANSTPALSALPTRAIFPGPEFTDTLPPMDTIQPTHITPSATPKSTSTRQPSITPLPTASPTATSTPYGPLSPTGPHLAYISTLPEGGKALTFINADASGRKIFPLPAGAYVPSLENALSPNGEWLAFQTGSAGLNSNGVIDLSGSLDLTLMIMHLPDGRITNVTKLLSRDYPANFDQVAALLVKYDPRYASLDLVQARQNVERNFLDGIRGLAWSPDSRFLAFSGEMDGPTSDLYLYDPLKSTINRLTDGIGQMTGKISWSPDGNWILHGSDNTLLGEGMTWDLFVVHPDGTGARIVDNSTNFGIWKTPNTIYVWDTENVIGSHDFRFINVETGEKKMIRDSSTESDPNAPSERTYAVCGTERSDAGESIRGIFVYQTGKPRLFIPFEDSCIIVNRDMSKYPYIVWTLQNGVFKLTADGKMEVIDKYARHPLFSPDNEWMLLITGSEGLALYDKDYRLVRELAAKEAYDVIWRQDSRGFFYISSSNSHFYYQNIPNGDPIQVEENTECKYLSEFNYRWIQ